MNELTIHLKAGSKVPLYEQIYTYIKENIRSGKIVCGERLPSTRSLCSYLEVSRSTVEMAYGQLLSEGYIEAMPCRGYFVTKVDELWNFASDRPVEEREEERSKAAPVYQYDFSPNGVDLKSFPYNVWRKLSKEVLQDDRTELFRLGDPKGEPEFRKAISRYLYQARGVNCTSRQIVVGAGSDYLLMLLGLLLGPGHSIAMENPTYKQAYRLFASQSFRVMPIAMDRYGMDVSRLEESKADIAYVTPSHQYPTGIIMPIGRRMELLRWAEEEKGRFIVEDDYDSEFRYKGKPVPALQGYDRNGKVIYLGTFSKSIAPAIRLSYMVLPAELCREYEKRLGFISSTVSKVDQMIMCRFIEEGYYERHLNKIRSLYKARHDQLLSGLRPLGKKCTIAGENAGVHLLLSFRDGRTEEELLQTAEQNGIRVYGLSDYIVEEKGKSATVLLGYANLTEQKIREACEILCRIWG